MKTLEFLLQQLQDTDAAAAQMGQLLAERPEDDVSRVNADAIRKRRNDLERRLNTELRSTQADLVLYHVQREGPDRYPALAITAAISGFQELVTAVFDAFRATPKQRYRPSADNIELSTLDFSMAVPTGSVVVSMSVGNERLLGIQSDLDRTFDRVFQLLNMRDSEGLRDMAAEVGIAAISKAHDWAASAAQYGLNTKITIRKDDQIPVQFEISNTDAEFLKEVIEKKSDQTIDPDSATGELLGIDVDRPNTYFHLKTVDGRNIEGKLADTFQTSRIWAVHVHYTAQLLRVTTVKYATGEEKIEWQLAGLEAIIERDEFA